MRAESVRKDIDHLYITIYDEHRNEIAKITIADFGDHRTIEVEPIEENIDVKTIL